MQSIINRNYKNNLLKLFLFHTHCKLKTFIPHISFWSQRRNVLRMSFGRFSLCGLLVDYLLIRSYGLVV